MKVERMMVFKTFDYYCCESYEVARNSNTMTIQLQMIQYIFLIIILSKDTRNFQRRVCLKNERYNKVEIRCSMSKTKYVGCEWDGKWIKWEWMTEWVSWILLHEINRWNLVHEMNEMKVTWQICNNPLLKHMKNGKNFFEFCSHPKYLLSHHMNHISSVLWLCQINHLTFRYILVC